MKQLGSVSITSNVLPNIIYFNDDGHYVYYSWHLANQYQQPEVYNKWIN